VRNFKGWELSSRQPTVDTLLLANNTFLLSIACETVGGRTGELDPLMRPSRGTLATVTRTAWARIDRVYDLATDDPRAARHVAYASQVRLGCLWPFGTN
jgi:hypothetical protein